MSIPTLLKSRVGVALLALSSAGALGIIAHEGMQRVAYKDPVGVVTVCAGHTATARLGQVKSAAQCADLLKLDVAEAERAVTRLVTARITQTQFDALVSLTFNVGSTNLAKSTLLRKVNTGDCWGAGKEFNKWVYAKGVQLPGLVTRRAYERKQWETGCAPIKTAQATPYKAGNAAGWAQARRPEHSPAAPLALSA